ncbi:MAG: Ku protein [Steroidobacteraceae bacterium]
MAARSLGSLTISFGLIAIPVNLFSATQSSGSISFNLLHKNCGSRLRQQYVCIKHDSVVERDEMVKGYEFAKGQYVQFTPEEIKAFDEVGTHSIDIAEFVAIEAIDPVYFDKSYYLAPDKGAGKPYALLTEALRQTNRCAIGRWAARGNSNIVMLRPIGNVLAMQQLRFANEVRSASELAEEMKIAATDVKAAELALAKQLVEQQSADKFDPADYVDEVKGRIEAAIARKVAGKDISISDDVTEPATGNNIVDLMEALRASLQKTQVAKTSVTKLGARKPPKRVEQPAKVARKTTRR